MKKKTISPAGAFYRQCQKQALRELLHLREVPPIIFKGAICSGLLVCAALGGAVVALGVTMLVHYTDVDFAKALQELGRTPPDILLNSLGAMRDSLAHEMLNLAIYGFLMTPFLGVAIQMRCKTERLFLMPRAPLA
ncbi:hypothetical protein [Kozakia baliensis]|uniref:Uncharacterized protein n=1 Tax=Kozakia baliensis TaxID=153496 RepID=A0A1D8UXP9_9PROT|nr:hypothetical protein [Kozakia baliensis]AOX18381.1 hypothetical protein A0U89_13735 [Kozakia baliensis]GBR33884.1 hypothetical protein AA0488_2787 [Kozakia baliensis NRIC 0488]GEL65398.1 hypothetical protein KBA01_26840 [Kozakia baliensis]